MESEDSAPTTLALRVVPIQMQRSQTTSTSPTFLSLPRELRDCIYSYLLCGQNVTTLPRPGSNSLAPRYRFQTQILRVNRQIAAAATQVLYQRNVFVVVSNQFRNWIPHLEMVDVSIITYTHNHVAAFKHHSLRLHFGERVKVGVLVAGLAGAFHEDKKLVVGSFLMLAIDLPSLYNAIQMDILQTAQARLCIHSVLGEKPMSIKTYKTARYGIDISAKLELRNTMHRTMSSEEQNNLLSSAKSMSGLFRLSIRGGHDAGYIDRLKLIMNPTIIWPRVMLWKLFDQARSMKLATDKMAEQHGFDSAALRYLNLSQLLTSIQPWLDTLNRRDPDVVFPYRGILLLKYFCWHDSASLSVRVGKLQQAVGLTIRLEEAMSTLSPVLRQTLIHKHSKPLIRLLALSDSRESTLNHEIASALELWDGVEKKSKSLVQDIRLVKQWQKLLKDDPAARLDRLKTSMCTRHFRPHSLALHFASAQMPVDFEGLQDKKHMQQLSDADKAAIHTAQLRNNLTQTDFAAET